MVQTATTGVLAEAQNTIIDASRFVMQHDSPSWNLIMKLPLPQGASTRLVPKVGEYTMSDLIDGQDMVDEQSIGMTNVTLTATERGGKIIVTDKLVRQNGTTPIFAMIGRQFGDAAVRKQERDTQALYVNLNGGVSFGLVAKKMTLGNFAGAIAKAKGGGVSTTTAVGDPKPEPFKPSYAVQHPHATFEVTRTATAIGSSTSMRVNDPREERMLNNFFQIRFNQVNLFESGNLDIDSSGDCIGVLAATDALVGLESKSWNVERERDASLRAWELNQVADYGVFELDDTKGAPLTFDATAPTDSA